MDVDVWFVHIPDDIVRSFRAGAAPSRESKGVRRQPYAANGSGSDGTGNAGTRNAGTRNARTRNAGTRDERSKRAGNDAGES